ncbi:MAG: UDP-N-acetylmuramoyl-L-alanine--D-glutamate ligase [Synergistaceae bacterium]|nr:UDP-N-acetylmuramoyl-L-alanine--D-glutamate ligase [Synergistaceae bacterium]
MAISGCGSRITVIGAGVSGLSTAMFAADNGYHVFLSDQGLINCEDKAKAEAKGVLWEEGGHTDKAWATDLVVLSSGIAPHSTPVQEAIRRGLPIIGEIDFVSPWLSAKLIGVTGSNGKTTTTALLAHLLKEAGFMAEAAGNIGAPLGSFVGRDLDYLIVELSSFQLHWAQETRLVGALLTNMAPDHIDWHGSYEAYQQSKLKIFNLLVRGGWGILQKRDRGFVSGIHGRQFHYLTWQTESADPGDITIDSQDIAWNINANKYSVAHNGLSILGRHNIENAAMAIVAAVSIGVAPDQLINGLKSFAPLPHRCEVIAMKKGILFVNDSKGTNVAAAVTALASLEGSKIILLGGKGKGEDYAPLVEALKRYAKKAVLYGEEGPALAEAIRSSGLEEDFFSIHLTLSDAFEQATMLADKGDMILLSPACTSWDQYKSYKDRGVHFQKLVEAF